MLSQQQIMLVLPWSPFLAGGVSVVVRNLAQHTPPGMPPARIVVSEWSASTERVDSTGILSFRFAVIGQTTLVELFKALPFLPFRLKRLQNFLSRHQVSAVNFHYPSLDAFGVAVLKRIGRYKGRMILSFHGTDVKSPDGLIGKKLWRFLLSQADGITACSAALAADVANHFAIDLVRVTAIHNGVDLTLFSPAAGNQAIIEQLPEHYLASVGSFLSRKGHRVLLDAFSLIADKWPEVSLVIAGMDGPEVPALQQQAQSLGLQDRLHLQLNLTPQQVAALMAKSIACIQPSHAEPFGLVIIEAGACGTPIAASAVGGHVELLESDDFGLLFPPGDPGACAHAIEQILADRKGAEDRAIRFRKHVLDHFSWGNCALSYYNLSLR